MFRYVVLILGFVAVPFIAFAQVQITEIMYDLGEDASGSTADAKREWIEILNNGSASVDLSDWRFNDGSNHKFATSSITNSLTLPAGAYAILASDAETFLSEHPGFNSILFDTVMSLNNTGSTLSLIDDNGATEDSVSYTSDVGGGGDGNSLQLVSGAWMSGSPTPGEANAAGGANDTPQNDTNTSDGTQNNENTPPPQETKKTLAPAPIKINFFADAGGDRTGVTGAPIYFTGRGYGLKGEPLQNALYTWNFGDGSYVKGERVSHIFMYPGTYRVMLDVSSDKYSASDAATVTITDADIEITYADSDRIEIADRTGVELDLSLWRLHAGDQVFTFPKETILLPEHVGIFPSAITGLTEENNVSLRYPNDKLAVAYDKNSIPIVFEQKTYVPETVSAPVSRSSSARKVAIASNDSIALLDVAVASTDPAMTDMTATTATSSELLTASAADSGGNMYPWLLGLVSIISVGSLLALSQKNPLPDRTSSKKEITADDITIID